MRTSTIYPKRDSSRTSFGHCDYWSNSYFSLSDYCIPNCFLRHANGLPTLKLRIESNYLRGGKLFHTPVLRPEGKLRKQSQQGTEVSGKAVSYGSGTMQFCVQTAS